MKIFFLCRTGHHTSLLAAGLYLKLIKENSTLEEINKLQGYDTISFKDIGAPFYVGKDLDNNEVFTIGVSSQPELLCRVVGDLLNLINKDPKEWRVVNFNDCVSNFTIIGIMLKRIRLNQLAFIMFNYGIKRELELLQSKLDNKLNRVLTA